jgi:hypothetical protein
MRKRKQELQDRCAAVHTHSSALTPLIYHD